MRATITEKTDTFAITLTAANTEEARSLEHFITTADIDGVWARKKGKFLVTVNVIKRAYPISIPFGVDMFTEDNQ